MLRALSESISYGYLCVCGRVFTQRTAGDQVLDGVLGLFEYIPQATDTT